MRIRSVRALLTAAVLAALPSLAAAQFPPPPAPVQDRWPNPPPPQRQPQAQPQQQPPPPAQRTAPPPRNAAAPANDAAAPPASKPRPQPAAPATAVVCNGVFAKDSTHLKLALKYDSRNIAFTDVDGPDGSKIKATVLYPHDPRRRLEVVWNNEASRSDTQVIAINGRSQWTAPKGLKLGMPLAALEKANGKPFKLSGFGADGSASVAGWEGGALSSLPGGCKVGIRLVADSKTPAAARSAISGDKELRSNDAALRTAKPTVGEILIGY